jgi:hypothetical protein
VDPLVPDLGVPSLAVTVHLVDTNHELLDTEQVDEHRVLAGLALDLSGLGVTLGDGRGEVTVGWDHEKADIGLQWGKAREGHDQ